MAAQPETIDQVRAVTEQKYKYGFTTDIESDVAPKGLNEDIVRFISAKKNEPEWLLEWRLRAFRVWQTMEEPQWAAVSFPPIDYQDAHYYAAPKQKVGPKSLDEVDPELLATYAKLGIPLREQEILAGVEGSEGKNPSIAVDAVFDSVSVATTFKAKLEEMGIIFCAISEAVQKHPDLVKKYLGSVVPYTDNFYATLNCAVFTDGSFVYIPKGVRCPMELSTYFRINQANTGQFERTLIIADADLRQLSGRLHGAPARRKPASRRRGRVGGDGRRDDQILHRAELVSRQRRGRRRHLQFRDQARRLPGQELQISWTQVETGSAITWKYPSCILQGDNSVGEFYSVAITNNRQQADTGTKMIHIGKNTRSTIVSKGISAGKAQQTYRGLVKILPKAEGARNHTQCDSLLIGDACGAHTVPYIESRNRSARIEHEATTAKISDDQLFYCRQRGISEEDAVSLIVNGFCKEVLKELPMEFAVEAQKLVGISLEGSVG